MEAVTRRVRDISESERRVLEHVLGRPLTDDQQIVFQVVTPGSDAAQAPRSGDVASADDLPEWCNVYEGLTDEEVADLESVILQRADLTRPS